MNGHDIGQEDCPLMEFPGTRRYQLFSVSCCAVGYNLIYNNGEIIIFKKYVP